MHLCQHSLSGLVYSRKGGCRSPRFCRGFPQGNEETASCRQSLFGRYASDEFRNEQLSDYRSELYTYLAIAGFFLINAFLAVLGTFWFRTQHRREELAIRITSGATPHSLMRLLMGEGILLVTFAYIPALIVAYNLGVADLVNTWPVEWSLGRFIVGGILTYFLLLVVVVFSIWFPARQAMKIQPAEALHGE